MLLNLVKAKSEEGVPQKVDLTFPLDTNLVKDKGCEIVSPVKLEGTMTFSNNELFLDATAEVLLVCICDICAEKFEKSFRFAVKEKFVEDSTQKNDENYLLNGTVAKVDEAVIDSLFLHFPSKIECKKGCRGLCSICGKNKNLFSCNCEDLAKEQEQLENFLQNSKIGEK